MNTRHVVRCTASLILLGTLALAAVPASVVLAGSDETACRVRNVTQDTHSRSFKRIVAAAKDGDRLRVRGSCASTGVVIDKDLIVRGIGQGATLQGRSRGRHRVLKVAEGARVELHDLIVQGGWLDYQACGTYPCRPKGAGILNRGRLTLTRVVVQHNGGLEVDGLGIWNGGTLLMRRSVVRANQDQDFSGAGIANTGTMTLRHSRVRDNDEGGIANGGVARLIDSVVADNHGGDYAHGISNSGSLTLIRSDVRNNRSYDDGGGIWNDGTLSVVDSEVRNNRAEGGGGGIRNGGRLTVVDSVIRNNSADWRGGGLWNASGSASTAVVKRSRIAGNRSYGVGGGIGNLGDLTLVDTVVRENRAREVGGGIYNGGLERDPLGTLAIDGASSVRDNTPNDCVGTPAC